MAKPRKSWEPKYRFGGNPRDFRVPAPLGSNANPYFTKLKPTKARKSKR